MFEGRFERLPLIDGERRIQGLITRKDVRFLRERPYASKDNKARLLTAAAIGCAGDYLERRMNCSNRAPIVFLSTSLTAIPQCWKQL